MGKKIYISIMIVLAAVIALTFCIHMYRTKEFNKQTYTLSENDKEDGCSYTFAPQNDNPISWTRTANIDGESIDLYACSIAGTFTNESEVEISDWTMRLDFTEDCYLNGAWCGVMEIHQNVQSDEKIQTLDLRKLEEANIELDYYIDGDIFLFPMSKGDYVVYHPSKKDRETPIVSRDGIPGETQIGVIIYWPQDRDFPSPSYTISYMKHKNFFQGKGALIGMIIVFGWLLLLVSGIASIITRAVFRRREEIELSKQEIERATFEKMLDEMTKALAYSIDAKDEYTHGHSERVAQYALKLAQRMNLSSEECKKIFYAGLLHDVGKIAIPEEIINKPGRLTDEEFEIIKTHPSKGEKILLQIEDMPYLAIGAKYHHERYDGFGYPTKTKGEDIPFLARIIAVADAYDAMTSQRSYRKTLDQSTVRQEICKGVGTQFDPVVAEHMIALIDEDVNYDMREK